MNLLRSLLLLQAILIFFSFQVKSQDEKANLLRGLNAYRASINTTAFTDNTNADCFANEVANALKSQPCSNSTGSDTVPGTEPQISNYPDLLSQCHLNFTDTRDGQVMPACVPGLNPDVVLTNYTESQYSQYLNDSTFTGAGIGFADDWVVVVLSTDTAGGDFVPVSTSGSDPNVVSIITTQNSMVLMILGIMLILLR